MSEEKVWKAKPGKSIDATDVAKIACALKSLAVYTSIACEEDDSPEDLRQIVQEGLDAIDAIFEY